MRTMKRADLQILADARVADSEALLEASRWPAAYYLLGYAVECAIKACVASQFKQDEVPERSVVNDFYTHRLDTLLSISGTRRALELRIGQDSAFQANWNMVRDWSEACRYDPSITESRARNMAVAVSDPSTGVLPWLKSHW